MESGVENVKICVMKPRWNDEDVEKIVRKQHTWLSGLIPPRSFEVTEFWDIYVPYILTGVSYYKNIERPRRCYVFENLNQGIKSGVMGIENFEFVDEDAPEYLEAIDIDQKQHAEDIAHYCNLRLLARNYRKFIHWNIDILDVRVMYRKKRVIKYEVNGKAKMKDLFLDSMILK